MKRTFNGNEIGYEQISRRYWVGGYGYAETTLFRVWNPARPGVQIEMTQTDFYTQTSPSISQAA